MRILRSLTIALLFIGGVFVASANVHSVELFYLPATGIAGWPVVRSIHMPLFLVVIATLVGGVLLGGLAAVLDQVRSRTGLRRARKERDRAVAEEGKAAALLDNALAETEGLRAEVAELREQLRAAGESEAAEAPLTAFLDAPRDVPASSADQPESGAGNDSDDHAAAASDAGDQKKVPEP